MRLDNPFIATRLVGSFVSKRMNNLIPFSYTPSSPVSSRFPKDTGDEVTFYLKSQELERVRCIVRFVEQNVSPKDKEPTRKDEDKLQKIGLKKTPKKNTWF